MAQSVLPPAEELQLVPLADIARGGMGMVQLAQVRGGRLDGRTVAVKRLNPEIEQDPEFVNMFLDETWMTAAIQSPNVVRLEAWGKDEWGMYLAVELVQGVSLSRLIKESRAQKELFAERTVAFMISQICGGLAAAHALTGKDGQPLGLVHRDLTPGNILCGFDGVVKIADFGIAKAEERLTSTRIGTMKGKPAYMAPEQARGGGIDARADLFSIGVVTFELLTGRRPWQAQSDLEMLVAVTTKPPTDLLELRKVQPVFVEVVRRCLEKDPNKRFGSAEEVRAMLDGWRHQSGFAADDEASLGAFVQRNTQQQLAWFKKALSGALTQGGDTFADVEARIDSKRKVTTDGNAPRGPAPAAGTAARMAAAAAAAASAPAGGGFDLPELDAGEVRGRPNRGVQPLLPTKSEPTGTPAPSAPVAALDEIDEDARTKFMERAPGPVPPAAGSSSGLELGAPAASSRRLGGTVSMDSRDLAVASGRVVGPPSPRAGDLPLPPPGPSSRGGLGGPPSSGGFALPPGGPAPAARGSNPTLQTPPAFAPPAAIPVVGQRPSAPGSDGLPTWIVVALVVAIGAVAGAAVAFRSHLGL